MEAVSKEDRFLFDLQGFLILRGVLSQEECARYLEAVRRLEARDDFDDRWMERAGPRARPTKELHHANQIRLNGLPRLDPIFDELIDHPRILPYLYEFMGMPALVNTWCISKSRGCEPGGWHRGVPTTDYSYRNGEIRTRMFNFVFLLTDNGPEDGCVVALPGSHKSNFDLPWSEYRGLELPGSHPVTGKAGDLFMFSETTIHDGLPKTTDGVRTNLYYNYVHAHYNGMVREPNNCHHFYFPPAIRERFNPQQRELTRWMEFARWEY